MSWTRRIWRSCSRGPTHAPLHLRTQARATVGMTPPLLRSPRAMGAVRSYALTPPAPRPQLFRGRHFARCLLRARPYSSIFVDRPGCRACLSPQILCVGTPRTQTGAEEEDPLNVGIDRHALSPPRSPWVVCYSRSTRTPPSPAQGPLAMMMLVTSTPPSLRLSMAHSDTPVSDPKDGPPLRPSPSPPARARVWAA